MMHARPVKSLLEECPGGAARNSYGESRGQGNLVAPFRLVCRDVHVSTPCHDFGQA